MPGKLFWGGVCQIWTRRSASRKGRGSNRTACTTLKMAVFAPIPRAMMRTVTRAKPGLLRRSLRANFRFWVNADMANLSIVDERSNSCATDFGSERACFQRMSWIVSGVPVSTVGNGCPVLDSGCRVVEDEKRSGDGGESLNRCHRQNGRLKSEMQYGWCGRFRGPSTPLRSAQDDAVSECWSGGGGLEVEALDEHAEDVFEGEVGFLDVHGDAGGDGDEMVGEFAHLAAACAGEADCGDLHLAGLFEGVEDIRGVAGGGDAEEEVAGLAECFDLAGKDLVEAEVVAACGEDGGVSGEGDGAESGAGVGEADDELGDEVLGVGGGASVTG